MQIIAADNMGMRIDRGMFETIIDVTGMVMMISLALVMACLAAGCIFSIFYCLSNSGVKPLPSGMGI